jgi:hypothetical protein
MALSLLTVSSCKEDPIPPTGGETEIRSIRITNGGLSGTETIIGALNDKVITFTIPAETNVAAVRFEGDLSLGARFEREAYDFLEGNEATAMTLTGTIRVVNGENYTDYEVTLNLNEPTASPVVDRLVVTANGIDFTASFNHTDNIIYLGVSEGVFEVAIKELVLRPARTAYEFTEATDGKLHISNPGSLELDFLGKTNEYIIDFGTGNPIGLDFSRAIVHDFSTATMMYPVFTGDMTRSADFDGEHVLIVYRNAPRVHRVTDLLAGNANNPIMLNVDPEIVNGGTHIMSAGRLSHGRGYITNLVTALGPEGTGETLKVYYYETPASAPKVVLEYDLDPEISSGPRLGDNISVNLNASGNGFVYFVSQDGNHIVRFTVAGFTNFSSPMAFNTAPIAFGMYAFVNPVEQGRNLITSTIRSVVHMIDNDGNRLFEFEKVPHREGARMDNGEATDIRIFNHNRARYMIMGTGKRWANSDDPTLIVYDISEGFDLMTALANWQDRVESEDQPVPVFMYTMENAPVSLANCANTNWAVVNGRLVIFTASANAGFALIEIPNNE